MANGDHKSIAGLQEIVSIKAGLNLGLPPKVLAAFSEVKAAPSPVILTQIVYLNAEWLVRFIVGDGSFTAAPYVNFLGPGSL